MKNESAPLVNNSHINDGAVTYGTDDAAPTTTTHRGTIGIWGSIAIAVNSLTGPAMLDLPATFQRSGLIPTVVALLFVCVLSALCSLHMANTISKYPSNLNFQREVEFSESFRYFWGHKWFVVTEVLFFCCITCLNISSIVDTAQVVDTFVGHFLGSSMALYISGEHQDLQLVHWEPSQCSAQEFADGTCLAFAQHSNGMLLTLGYLVTAAVYVPMSLSDLKENATFQIVGFVVLLATSFQFAVEFGVAGLDVNNLTLWGTSWDTLFGVVLFNFALVIAVPAWLYEKHVAISVPTVINGSSGLSTVLYIVVGGMGALAIPNISDNMLESMMSGTFGTSMQLGSCLFAFMIIGLGIPLFSVLTRMNLTGGGLTTHRVGNLLAVYLPWSISWMFYQGNLITQLLSWGGVFFTSAVAFLLPLMLALHTVLEFDQEGSIQVYGSKGWIVSKRAQIVALVVLITLAVLSVGTAVAGTFWMTEGDDIDNDTDNLLIPL